MCIECFSCAVKLLRTRFIKIIRAYGALIISVIPGTCNGDSVFSLLFFKPKCEEYISQKLNLALYFVPILHFNLKGWRKWKGSLKPCEIRKTRDEGNKMVEWEREELWAFLICPSPAILLMTCYFWINRNEETCSAVIFQAWYWKISEDIFFPLLILIILDVATVVLKIASRARFLVIGHLRWHCLGKRFMYKPCLI